MDKQHKTVTWCPYCYTMYNPDIPTCFQCNIPLVTTDDDPSHFKVADGFCKHPCFFSPAPIHCAELRKFREPIPQQTPWWSGMSFIETLFEVLKPEEEVENLLCYKSLCFVPSRHPDRFHYHILIKKLKAKRTLIGSNLNRRLLELDKILLDHWKACGWYWDNFVAEEEILEDITVKQLKESIEKELVLITEAEAKSKAQVNSALGDNSFEYLIEKAKHRCQQISSAAFAAIVNCGGERVMATISELFNFYDPHIRLNALLEFTQMEIKYTIEYFITALNDQNKEIVETSIRILSSKRKQSLPAVESLTHLANSNSLLRLSAIDALYNITVSLRYKILYKILSAQETRRQNRKTEAGKSIYE